MEVARTLDCDTLGDAHHLLDIIKGDISTGLLGHGARRLDNIADPAAIDVNSRERI